jgi:SNF2 family DNA or RNA helicase
LLPEDFTNEVHESAKLNFLIELLALLIEEGRRILLFSQFTTMLGLIEAHLVKEKIAYIKLTGASKDRGKLVEDFQTGKASLFLISLKAGGTGLNLTAADTVIHYDPWWNPAAEAQATDRAYRIGQDKPVFVHKLLCQETVEERIHKLQQEKGKLAAGILADADISKKLDAAMVRSLLDP